MLTSYFRYEGGFMIHLVITIEETLEMLGIVLFIYSILDYIKNTVGSKLRVNVDPSPQKEVTFQKPSFLKQQKQVNELR